MSQDDFDQIRPADLQLNIDSEHGEPVPAPPRRTGVNAGIAIALTAALGAAAIILLPRLIGPSEQPVPAKVEQTSPPASPVATPAARPEAPNGLSPFEQAQRERERQLARDALDALLQLQFELEEQGAEQWAAEDYGAALEQARAGDEVYRTNDFTAAAGHYQRATALLTNIADTRPARLQSFIEQGQSALETFEADAATAAFSLALLIDNSSQPAVAGLQRAQTLDEAVAALRRGQRAEQTADKAAAIDAYRDALAIDNALKPAKDALQRLETEAAEARFNELMSEGFTALSSDRPAEAIQHFDAALKIKPQSSAAKDAREQARFQISQSRIGRALADARQAESDERWQDAAKQYAAALKIDAGLSTAISGQRDAQTRLALDTALARVAADESALQGDKAITAARNLVTTAAAIPAPGPRLRAQIVAAEQAITAAITPRPVQIRSDGETEVTVFRVGRLGMFEQQHIELIPGNYVAVGRRTGFQDVRVEFAVSAANPTAPVTVRCTRRI